MAKLNGIETNFEGLTFRQIGERLLDASPSGDGKGITLEFDYGEERGISSVFGIMVGKALREVITDALQERTGQKPKEGLGYKYSNFTFTT